MSDSFEIRARRLVETLGLASASEIKAVRPLTGGVASDIGVVETPDGQICVKFALEKLKVGVDWHAPVHRNKAEYDWLRVAAGIVPESVPALLGRSEAEGGFAMEFLQGNDVYLWKEALLKSELPQGEAEHVAHALGKIHAATALSDFNPAPFNNADDFHALRLEPFFLYTADRHPKIASQLNKLAQQQFTSRIALVHGDVSPKNILFRKQCPIILDAECATMGDPAFDASFCMTHLLLKSLHLPQIGHQLLSEVSNFWDAYKAVIDWEDPIETEARIVRLIPALLLARIDGKSPVEYLSEQEQTHIRNIAIHLIETQPASFAAFLTEIQGKLMQHD